METLGVIPARAGSKRFPRKNVVLFKGKPLIAWTILAAQRAKYLNNIIVSTDDPEIQFISWAYGCKVLKRPAGLATDAATSEDVMRHALINYPADYVVLLQPTSPFRAALDIDACVKLCHVEHRPVVSYRANGGKNGAVYVCASAWLADHSFADEHLHYTMPEERSLDIDYPEDVVLSRHC